MDTLISSSPAPVARARSLFGVALAVGLGGFAGAQARAAALSIPYPGIDPGTVGVAYSKTYAAAGGKTPYTWSVPAGTMAPGLALSSKGVLSGKPTLAGDYKFSMRVTDAAAATVTVSEDLWIGAGAAATSGTGSGTGSSGGSGTAPAAAPLSIPYPGIDPGTVGLAYTKTYGAAGGKPPYTWSVSSGALAPGLTLSSAGVLAGTPTLAGDYQFQMRVTDAAATAVTVSEDLWVGGGSAGSSSGTTTGTGSGGGSGSGSGGTTASAQFTVTVVNGTLNGSATASGSFAPGTAVAIAANPAPAGQVFQDWVGASVAASTTAATTLTVPSANVTVTAVYFTPPPIPQPVTGHPRLWITPTDLPRLQSWATAANPVYQQGLLPLLNGAIAAYHTQFFPGGTASAADVPNPTYPDVGDTQGYTGLLSEQYGMLFALHALIDPSPAARIQHAQRARNLLMYALNQAALGPLANAPFRDPLFPVYNRANFTSEAWPLIVDWIYNATNAQGAPILTAADKAVVRSVFLTWAAACLNASTTGGDHPSPVGTINSPALLPGGSAYRMASNNYYLGHARLLTMMALALDPADDPAVNPAVPAAVLGNSLRSYIPDATGAWLYQEFAMLGDPAAVQTAYGLTPNSSVGLASGGLPPEGMLYGHSYSFIFGQLLALKTAGFADPALSGPQVALVNDPPVFDRFMKGFATSLVPTAQVFPGYEYMGPVYQMASYGDILRLWITSDFVQPFALLSLLDQKNGDSSRLNAERWFAVNAVEGGAANLLNRIQNPWSYGVQDALYAFLLLDPTAAPATDPRPGYPTAFYDAPQGRLVEHSDWTPNGVMFDFRSSWISINHQQADGNQFEFYRKGEWLTKGVANYDNNSNGLTTDYHNTLSLQNWCANGTPTNLGWWEGPFWANGSQWQLAESAGDPVVTTSVGTTYTYAFGDTTNLYNRPSFWTPANAALDILQASRSLLWLKPDHIVVYDRATSHTAGLFKRFSLAVTAAPMVNGSLITTTTPGGQHLYISALLPAAPTVSTPAIGNALNPMAELEPSTYRIVIQDPANPTDERFLTVLQGADPGAAADPTALVQSSAGTAFDGALILDTVVLFARNPATAFAGVTYSVPSTTAHHYVTGLAASTGYLVTTQVNGASIQVTISAGGPTLTDAAGVLSF